MKNSLRNSLYKKTNLFFIVFFNTNSSLTFPASQNQQQ